MKLLRCNIPFPALALAVTTKAIGFFGRESGDHFPMKSFSLTHPREIFSAVRLSLKLLKQLVH
ncbi:MULTISPECIES: hypothetical protein [Variovorax]|jgi:hypothetical protein|uniref:hypothetical protein n=1 Tax=Variovorax atrisoli TaxID=3394203 RepID=UPI0012FE4EF7|nr:hypothetical protein [Variovorax paradoxus]